MSGERWTSGISWRWLFRIGGVAFLAYPVATILATRPAPVDAVLAILGTTIFLAYLALAFGLPVDDRRRSSPAGVLGVLLLVGIAVIVSVHDRQAGWYALFYYASVSASALVPVRRGAALIGLAGIAATVTIGTQVGDLAGAIAQGLAVTMIGGVIASSAALRRTNGALIEARTEVARLAVSDERSRIARDLHDTLGHSLSLIALKSELAGRLLPTDPDRARSEIADVERVAREALASVRETVSGYRRPTLAAELAGARTTLAAAGIEPSIDEPPGALPPSIDTALAWVVREGVTNVVRHSGATRVAIRIGTTGAWATADIVDNGVPTADPALIAADDRGSGLIGLRERISALGGRVEAGSAEAGGFELRVRLPTGGSAW